MPNNITEAFRKAHCGKTSIPLRKEVCAFFFFFEDSEVQRKNEILKLKQNLIEVQLKLLQYRLDVATVVPATKDDIAEAIKRATQNR